MDDALTEDRLLGGRVALRQPRDGFRSGLDAVLAAAAVPATPGARVLDMGCGVGAIGLCLAARVPGVRVTGIEIDDALADVARANARLNGADLDVVTGDATGRLSIRGFRHLVANPPFHDAARHRAPASAGRARAMLADEALLSAWVAAGAKRLETGGTITLILRADQLGEVFVALGTRFGAGTVMPVHPMADRPATRILVRAVKGRRTPPAILPGLILHEAGGGWTARAHAILADAAPI